VGNLSRARREPSCGEAGETRSRALVTVTPWMGCEWLERPELPSVCMSEAEDR